jgi:threonine synthase
VVYLGEGHTPVVAVPPHFASGFGLEVFIKHDGLNPSASFKDRGMAAALSYLNHLRRTRGLKEVLAVCASTGDTSAAAALYAAALGPAVKSAVLLPRGKVTPAQLGQPLGAGARVIELPGVFDDCMKVVERLSERYEVALLNSKNPWRVLGQESYAFEAAQAFDYEMGGLALFLPVGNAGNLTALLSGLLKLRRYGVIEGLPKVGAVQSIQADPVFRYFSQSGPDRVYAPVTVRPSVAQAAMIGDPVSFPRVVRLAEEYRALAGEDRFFVVQVTESEIMEHMIRANRAGLTVCTQGGEALAGLAAAVRLGLVRPGERALVDSTAHALKFADFQAAYWAGGLEDDYGVRTDPALVNRPLDLDLTGLPRPEPGRSQSPADRAAYVAAAALAVARALGLTAKPCP